MNVRYLGVACALAAPVSLLPAAPATAVSVLQAEITGSAWLSPGWPCPVDCVDGWSFTAVFSGNAGVGNVSNCDYHGSIPSGTTKSTGRLVCTGSVPLEGTVSVTYRARQGWTMFGDVTIGAMSRSVTGAGPAPANGTLYFG